MPGDEQDILNRVYDSATGVMRLTSAGAASAWAPHRWFDVPEIWASVFDSSLGAVRTVSV